MIRARISSQKDLEQAAKELFHVLVNLRHWEKGAKENGGSMYAMRVKAWQETADKLIEKLTNDLPESDYDAAASILHDNGFNLARQVEGDETLELNVYASPILMKEKEEQIQELLGTDFIVSGNTNLQYIIVKKR